MGFYPWTMRKARGGASTKVVLYFRLGEGLENLDPTRIADRTNHLTLP